MLNVLIVEDDLLIADLLQQALEADGYRVTGVARTVGEAMTSVAQHEPDFAVIDCRLADGGLGTEVGSKLRSHKGLGILYSTGNDDQSLTALQGDAVMMKPYRMRDVGRGLKIIQDLVSVGRSELPFPRNFRLLAEG